MSPDFYRRHLPHAQPDAAIIFVTFRIAGSLPPHTLDHIRITRDAIKADEASGRALPEEVIIRQKQIFAYYDQALGDTCAMPDHPGNILHKPAIAPIIIDRIGQGVALKKFSLHRYCVMPNHIHLLIEPLTAAVPPDLILTPTFPSASTEIVRRKMHDPDNPAYQFLELHQIMKGLKGSAARDINKITGQTGKLFQQESFDHYIRTEQEYRRVTTYINQNPVAAHLSPTPEQYPWTGPK